MRNRDTWCAVGTATEAKDELLANARRREELTAQLKAAEEPPPLLHPSMAEAYRMKVEQLAAGLEHPDEALRESAREAVLALIQKIVIPADEGQPLMVFGELGKMLAAAASGRDGSTLVS